MSDLNQLFILFLAGIAAGFINVNAGGGSTLTLPMLIFLGLDASVANGTNRIGILLQNLSAVSSFKREQYSRFKLSFKLALMTLPGAIIGAFFSISISNKTFEMILALIMIGVIITMIIPKKKVEVLANTDGEQSWKVYLAMFGIGFYGGFIQVGVGFLLMAALHHLMKLSLVHVNMHKVFIIFFYTIPALLIFILSDNVNWVLGLVLAAGTMTGAWWGAKFSIKKGEKYIRAVLIIAILIMAVKLLRVF